MNGRTDLPRARQGARRLQQHQRDDLPARQPAGLRALGAPTPAWRPGTTRTACRTSSGWRRAWRPSATTRSAGTPGRSCSNAGPATNPLFGAFFEAVQQAGYPADRRRQRLPAGGVRAVRSQRARRAPPVGRPRLPPPGDAPAEPRREDARVRDAKILFEGTARSASSTRTRRTPHRVRAGEVVLCGGAINSPQTLQLSGVGNADELKALGIDVVADVPGVGENLQDHLEVYIQYACTQPVSVAPYMQSGGTGRGSVLEWLLFRQGPGRDEPLRGRRVRAEQRRRRLPEPDVPLPADRDPLRRLGAGGRPRLPGAHRPDVLGRARHRGDHEHGPARAPGAAVQLPVDRPGPARVGRGDPRRARHPEPAGDRAVQRRRDLTRAERSRPTNRSCEWVARDGETALHPSCTCEDGRRDRSDGGGRPADDARARHRGPARRRRLGVPLRHERQHLRAGDDGGREGGRPDPRQHARSGRSRSRSTGTAPASRSRAETEQSRPEHDEADADVLVGAGRS